jgi:hypothetical protein
MLLENLEFPGLTNLTKTKARLEYQVNTLTEVWGLGKLFVSPFHSEIVDIQGVQKKL